MVYLLPKNEFFAGEIVEHKHDTGGDGFEKPFVPTEGEEGFHAKERERRQNEYPYTHHNLREQQAYQCNDGEFEKVGLRFDVHLLLSATEDKENGKHPVDK